MLFDNLDLAMPRRRSRRRGGCIPCGRSSMRERDGATVEDMSSTLIGRTSRTARLRVRSPGFQPGEAGSSPAQFTNTTEAKGKPPLRSSRGRS